MRSALTSLLTTAWFATHGAFPNLDNSRSLQTMWCCTSCMVTMQLRQVHGALGSVSCIHVQQAHAIHLAVIMSMSHLDPRTHLQLASQMWTPVTMMTIHPKGKGHVDATTCTDHESRADSFRIQWHGVTIRHTLTDVICS